MNQLIMMTMLGMMNPAAANAMQPMCNNMMQQMQRSQNISTEFVDSSSSDNESDEHD